MRRLLVLLLLPVSMTVVAQCSFSPLNTRYTLLASTGASSAFPLYDTTRQGSSTMDPGRLEVNVSASFITYQQAWTRKLYMDRQVETVNTSVLDAITNSYQPENNLPFEIKRRWPWKSEKER